MDKKREDVAIERTMIRRRPYLTVGGHDYHPSRKADREIIGEILTQHGVISSLVKPALTKEHFSGIGDGKHPPLLTAEINLLIQRNALEKSRDLIDLIRDLPATMHGVLLQRPEIAAAFTDQKRGHELVDAVPLTSQAVLLQQEAFVKSLIAEGHAARAIKSIQQQPREPTNIQFRVLSTPTILEELIAAGKGNGVLQLISEQSELEQKKLLTRPGMVKQLSRFTRADVTVVDLIDRQTITGQKQILLSEDALTGLLEASQERAIAKFVLLQQAKDPKGSKEIFEALKTVGIYFPTQDVQKHHAVVNVLKELPRSTQEKMFEKPEAIKEMFLKGRNASLLTLIKEQTKEDQMHLWMIPNMPYVIAVVDGQGKAAVEQIAKLPLADQKEIFMTKNTVLGFVAGGRPSEVALATQMLKFGAGDKYEIFERPVNVPKYIDPDGTIEAAVTKVQAIFTGAPRPAISRRLVPRTPEI